MRIPLRVAKPLQTVTSRVCRCVRQSGACAFARDPEAGAQVWSAEAGYPGDPDYREYYRDIGYDLGQDGGAEWAYLKPYVLPDGARINTGFKYYSVTGDGDAKVPYHPARAAQKAQQHAEHFIASRVAQVRRLAERRTAAGAAKRVWQNRRSSYVHTMPSCSGTGGTKATSGLKPCCAALPRAAMKA